MPTQLLEEQAQVTRVEGDLAWVETQRQTSCGTCLAEKACGTGQIAKLFGARKNEMSAINHIGAQAGDTVIIALRGDALLIGSLVVYLLPLLLLFVMALLGDLLGQQLRATDPQSWSMAFAALGLALGFGWVRIFGKRIRHDPRYQPVVTRRVTTVP